LTAQALKVRKEGKFIQHVGLVCPWFDQRIHIVDIETLPPGDTLFGLDYGFSAPACGLSIRIDREGNWWGFRGFYRKGLAIPKISALIKQKEAGIRGVIQRIADSAQADAIQQMCDEGIDIVGVTKESGSTKENWDQYRASLLSQYGALQEATGKPKLFICSSVVDEDDSGVLV